jgi:hypothetical protein
LLARIVFVVETDIALAARRAGNVLCGVRDTEKRPACDAWLRILGKAQFAGLDVAKAETSRRLKQQNRPAKARATRLRVAGFELEPASVRESLQQRALPFGRAMTWRRSM